MRAFQITTRDSTPALVDVADPPSPGPGEIAVEIAACALNFADILMAKGSYQDMPPLPATLGMELAGTVAAAGDGVTRLATGDRVAIFAGHGGLAERGVFAADRALVLPDDMPFETAAAFQVAYGTTHLALTERARLADGETLLVTGASGGVGLTAVEMGKTLGARVIALARGAEKLEVARAAGADILIDSDAPDWRDTVRAAGGADVVYEVVGGEIGETALRCLNPLGRFLVIGFAGGKVPQFKANHLLVKNIDVIGYYWGGYADFAPDRLRDSLSALVDMWRDGRLKPHVSHVLPLARAGEGLALLAERKATGKVVVTVG